MRLIRKDDVKEPIENPTGERIYSMIGAPEDQGASKGHSLAYVVIPPGKSSLHHYHPVAEETYYILAGKAKMIVDGEEFPLKPGDALLIHPPEKHQIFSVGEDDLEFVVVCAPPWEPTNTVYLDENGDELPPD